MHSSTSYFNRYNHYMQINPSRVVHNYLLAQKVRFTTLVISFYILSIVHHLINNNFMIK